MGIRWRVVTFVGKKLCRMTFVLFAVTAVTFFMVNLLPGDVAYMLGGPDATAEEIQGIRKAYGLDTNIIARYFSWLHDILRGDFGKSYLTREPVLEAIVNRLPVTVELIVVSQVFALSLALPAGVYCAYRNQTIADRCISGFGFALLSIPSFVMALFLIFVFALRLNWLPATGYIPLSESIPKNIQGFLLPGLSIALIEWVPLMRVLRTDMMGTLKEDFIMVANAKGMPPWRVLFHHALKPSSLTLLTVFGLQMGHWIGAAVIIEMIYALPGIGRLLVNAVFSRDYLVVQGCVIIITVAYVVINVSVDILYTVLDPRIRQERGRG
jgi:peptide/nickel transport system permease protein